MPKITLTQIDHLLKSKLKFKFQIFCREISPHHRAAPAKFRQTIYKPEESLMCTDRTLCFCSWVPFTPHGLDPACTKAATCWQIAWSKVVSLHGLLGLSLGGRTWTFSLYKYVYTYLNPLYKSCTSYNTPKTSHDLSTFV